MDGLEVSICFPAWCLPSRCRQTAFAATPTICGLTMGIGAVIVSQVIFPNPARSRSTFEHSKNGGRVVQLVCEGCGEDEGTGPKVAIYSAPIGFYVLSQPTTVDSFRPHVNFTLWQPSQWLQPKSPMDSVCNPQCVRFAGRRHRTEWLSEASMCPHHVAEQSPLVHRPLHRTPISKAKTTARN